MAPLQGRALLAAVTTLTSLGFLLIGYDNGLMGGLVNGAAFTETFGIEDTERGSNLTGLIVAIYEIGCFFGAIATSFFGEKLGRRYSTLIGVCIMLVGALLQATAYTVAHMIVGRVVSGFGMGFINSTVPVMQAEFAPKASRGLFVCMQLSTLNFGIMMVYWIDYAFGTASKGASTSYVWRVPVILQVVFLFGMIAIIFMIPETPRWLAAHDRNEECLQVLRQVNAGRMSDEDIQAMHTQIVETVTLETASAAASWGSLLKEDALHTRRRFFIACAIQIFQQLGGINALIYFSATIFGSVGFDGHFSALMSGFLNTWFFLASFIPWLLIDRVGRRPLLLSMISVMAIVMAVQAALTRQIDLNTPIRHACGIGAAAMLFIFQGAFTIGFQATVWVYPSEILPLQIRQKGSAISTASNWIINFMIVYITPVGLRNIQWRFYIIFAVFNACFVPIIYLFFPETKGMALEDVDRLFCEEDASALVRHGSLPEKSINYKEEHLEKAMY